MGVRKGGGGGGGVDGFERPPLPKPRLPSRLEFFFSNRVLVFYINYTLCTIALIRSTGNDGKM